MERTFGRRVFPGACADVPGGRVGHASLVQRLPQLLFGGGWCGFGWSVWVSYRVGNRGWHLGRLDSRVFFNCSRTAWSSLRVAILSMSLCCFSFSLARIAATSASDLGGVSASVDTSGRVSEAPRRPGAIGRTHLLDPLFRRCIERSVARFVAPTPRAPPMAACGHSAAHIADDIAEVVLTRP